MIYVDKFRMLYDVLKGDIFRVKMDGKYIMHESGMCAALFKCIDSMQSNNGNFRAVDDAGRLHWFNTVTDEIYLYRRTKEATDNRTVCKISKQRAAIHHIVVNAPVRFHATWDDLDAAEDMCLPNDTDL